MGKRLFVFIEKNGEKTLAGSLNGDDYRDTRFRYDEHYLRQKDAKAISLNLPLRAESFDPDQTRCFFNGLLPEGYTRRCIAAEINAGDDDYVKLLEELGRECLGAVQILPADNMNDEAGYERISDSLFQAFAREGATRSVELVTKSHLSLTGASGKAGLYYDEDENGWYLPLGSAPSTHIVKQRHIRLNRIVLNEQLCMLTAKKMGIQVPDSRIIAFHDRTDDGNVLFVTKRYDRLVNDLVKQDNDGHRVPLRLHQEDFAQALGIQSERKYEKDHAGYLGKMFRLLSENAADPIQAQMALWRIVVFNYFIGNTDNHIKNTSLLYSASLDSIQLAPAYDMVSTLVYDSSTEDMAVSVNGKYNIYEVQREDFKAEAEKDGLNMRICMREYDRMKSSFSKALKEAKLALEQSGFSQCAEVYSSIINVWKKRFSTSDE